MVMSWEYCEVRLFNAIYVDETTSINKMKGWSYECDITYYSPEGDITLTLGAFKQALPYNPFNKALSFLGVNGWELVSIQCGAESRTSIGIMKVDPGVFRWDNKIAFLKRPIQQGRRVDQPKIFS